MIHASTSITTITPGVRLQLVLRVVPGEERLPHQLINHNNNNNNNSNSNNDNSNNDNNNNNKQ